MSLASRVLAGLVAGTLIGLALAGRDAAIASAVLTTATLIGGLFIDLIRMCAMPLVASLVVSSLGASGAGTLGRTGLRTLVIAVATLVVVTVASMAVSVVALRGITPDPAAFTASTSPAAAPSLVQWVRDLVPANVVKAAADGAMLPVILFVTLFGLALARIAPARRDAVLAVAQGVADAMQQLVGSLLRLAPLGVFALAIPLAARLGLSAAGALATYVALVVALTIAAIALLYPLGVMAGGMRLGALANYFGPSQALAFASRSSLATLPAMVQASERAGFDAATSRLVMPLAVSVFHVGTAVAQTVGVLFLARLGGVTLSGMDLATVAAAVVVASSAVPGVPGGSIVALVPALTAARVPVEGIGLLLAVDAIPDMVRTTANVTGAMALAAIARDRTGRDRRD
ncbi:MAG: cation:dicarboxylase symporter family transporter [Vicinamibacterales bacterium]